MPRLKIKLNIDPLPWPLRVPAAGAAAAVMTPFDDWQYRRLQRRVRAVFREAVSRWKAVLIGWPRQGPDQLVVDVRFGRIDGADGPIVASGHPTDWSRPKPGFPKRGEIRIDAEDFEELALAPDVLFDVVLHELGHVFGLGTAWKRRGRRLVRRDASGNWHYVGDLGVEAFTALVRPGHGSQGVPVSAHGAGKDRSFHWDEQVLRLEIMSTELTQARTGVHAGSNVISAVTVGALADLGYRVDHRAAQPLEMPCGTWTPRRASTSPRQGRRRCNCR